MFCFIQLCSYLFYFFFFNYFDNLTQFKLFSVNYLEIIAECINLHLLKCSICEKGRILKGLYIILLSILTLSNAYSQKHFNNWYFGNKAGITFNTPSGEPDILLDGAMETDEGCSTFSDSSGNLTFYKIGRASCRERVYI